jgi:hypothetical protein
MLAEPEFKKLVGAAPALQTALILGRYGTMALHGREPIEPIMRIECEPPLSRSN